MSILLNLIKKPQSIASFKFLGKYHKHVIFMYFEKKLSISSEVTEGINT